MRYSNIIKLCTMGVHGGQSTDTIYNNIIYTRLILSWTHQLALIISYFSRTHTCCHDGIRGIENCLHRYLSIHDNDVVPFKTVRYNIISTSIIIIIWPIENSRCRKYNFILRTLNYIYLYIPATSSIDLTIYMVRFSGVWTAHWWNKIGRIPQFRRASEYFLYHHNPVRDGSDGGGKVGGKGPRPRIHRTHTQCDIHVHIFSKKYLIRYIIIGTGKRNKCVGKNNKIYIYAFCG